jgi:hypothetical protein
MSIKSVVLGLALALVSLGTLAVVNIRIPVDELNAKFGPKHPFKLLVHGPNPVFTQGGYTFRANTDGFLLSDEYYYDVPVFITLDFEYHTNKYRLYSTKADKPSVDVDILKEAK